MFRLKATVSVCTPCTVLSYSTTSVHFNTPPLTMIAPTNSDNCLCLSVSHIRRWIDRTDVPSSCGGVWDPWSVEYNPETLQCCCSTEAETGFVPTSAQSFNGRPFLILRSPSCTRSCTQKIIVYQRVSFWGLLNAL